MAGLFDDLVAANPAPPAAAGPTRPKGLFDDLVAATPAPAVTSAVDPVRAQVRKEIDAQHAQGVDTSGGLPRRILQGATFNLADEVLAAGNTIPEMIKRGTWDPRQGYAFAKAKEDINLEDARENGGWAGKAAEVAGGLTSGIGLMRAGVTALPRTTSVLGNGVAGTAAGLATDGAVIGGLSGAADENGNARITGGVYGAAIGGGVGAALPVAAKVIGQVAAPVVSNVRARMDPTGYAERQIGKTAADARLGADDVAGRLTDAVADGQTEYRLMDALGYPGQRKAAVVAKNPGEGRAELREFLDDRQAGQGRRVIGTLADGFDAPISAGQAKGDIKNARNAAADTAYGQARADADAVDMGGVISRIDETLRPGISGLANPGSGIANDSVEAVLARARALLTDGRSQVSGFEAAQRIKGDLDDMVSSAVRAGQGNRARLLGQVARELDTALEAASPSYAGARDAYRQSSRQIDAIDVGQQAAKRGRTEDIRSTFDRLAPEEQAGFRVGYADPLVEGVQGSAMGVNNARPFTSLAMREELPAFAAPGRGDQMMRRIGRENEMFATRAEAGGNSKTFENFADDAANGIDVGAIAKLFSGDVFGAGKDALRAAGANLSGNTEAVRAEMARILMKGDPAEVKALLERVAAAAAGKSQAGQYTGRALESGGAALIGSLGDSSAQGTRGGGRSGS